MMENAMAESAKSIGEQVGDLAHAVGGAVGKKAEEVADRSREMGADLASGLGEKVGAAADRIGEKSPSLAQHVRDTADKVNQFADELNDKKAADLLQSAMDFGRAHPFMMLAGAALVGFALARVVGPGSAARSKGDSDSAS
jgi:hypothetical protein